MGQPPVNAAQTCLVLGPQRPQPNLGDACQSAGISPEPMAVISAGMQEAEGDLDHVERELGRPLVDLRLYQRAEALFAVDTALASAYRKRQEQLQELQALYRQRLKPLATAVRNIYRTEGDGALLQPERRHAMAQLRALDQHHLGRVEAIHAEFQQRFDPGTHVSLAPHREAISATIERCASLLLTGGNVIVLLNRMRLFGMGDWLNTRPLVAWSAGAMVLGRRIALFHDRLPMGRRDPELLGAGFGLLPGQLFLPDAERRLRRRDGLRTRLFGLRFGPETCITLDNGAAVRFEGRRLQAAEGARRIARSGRLKKVRPT